MMVQIKLHEQACRGCRICVDICPTEVFGFDEETEKCRVDELENCIACLSCAYACPSGALSHSDYHVVKNFYRDLEFCDRMEKFL